MSYVAHPTALVSPEAVIGHGTRIWAFANIQPGVVIGRDCKISDHCFIEKGAVLGDRVTVKNGVSVFEGVTLEDDVFVGPNAAFVNDRHPRSRAAGWVLEKSVVRRGASLGANSTILCGVEIGVYAVIGAGCVVVRHVPAHAIMAGNPARRIGWADIDGSRIGEDFKGRDGRQYAVTPAGLVLSVEGVA